MFFEIGFRGIMATNPAIMYTLLIFSVLVLAFVIERAIVFMAYGSWDAKLWSRINAHVRSGRFHEARALCEKGQNVFSAVFYSVLKHTGLSRIDNEDLAQIAKENAQEKLRKRLGLFATFSFICPLVGLLGTVTGIMQAFTDLGRSGSGGANIVASGIAEALVTTAAGIVVAVPSAIFYNFFTYKLRSITVRMNSFSNELIILIYGNKAARELHQDRS